ncbi:tryptophan 5-hydroxylase isoform X3 [Rhinoraja longicauda]
MGGRLQSITFPADRTMPCSLRMSYLLAEPNQTMMEKINKSNFCKIEESKENKENCNVSVERGRVAVVFSLKNEVGGLAKALRLFQEKRVNLVHIESRKSKRRNSEFEIFLDCDSDREQLNEVVQILKSHVNIVTLNSPDKSYAEGDDMESMQWFPKKISDLDKCANRVLMYGSDLDADHPGFKDNVYRKRRKYFADVAMDYKYDTCHELMGHVPLLAEPSFAQFSQEIGLASLGASDEAVQKLATCYFFTVEFGLCKQDGLLRVYGAGLLSSVSELKYSISGNAKVKPFDPKVTCKQECLITTFQDVYFVSESFEEAKEKMREFAKTIKRPFSVRYNPYTQTVDVLKDTKSIANVVKELRNELDTISDALSRMNKHFGI